MATSRAHREPPSPPCASRPLASIGAALGLGFLSQWEGLFVNTLLRLFAWIALGWLSHRQWQHCLAGIIGPVIVLLSLYPRSSTAGAAGLCIGGLVLMLAVAVWDRVSPAGRKAVN